MKHYAERQAFIGDAANFIVIGNRGGGIEPL